MSLTYADAQRELVDDLDERLRAAVRREGIDPQRDDRRVRELAGGWWPSTTSAA